MSEYILDIQDLSKSYGKKIALSNFNLKLKKGDLFGLIGPNGAGKTTTFKIISTIMKPTSGKVLIEGMDITVRKNIPKIRKSIAYMPDSFGVYEDMRVEEYLNFFAAAYDIVGDKRKDLVNDVLELVDLDVKRSSLVNSLSLGMQQRLGLARVLIHDPNLLILDEPASGLDPRARVEIRSLLMELQKMGKTIIISSHILADLGEICNRVGIIEQGNLLVDGSISDVLASVKPSPIIYVKVAENSANAIQLLSEEDYIVDSHLESDSIVLTVKENFDESWRISQLLIENGYKLNYLQAEAKSLEHAFMELTEGKVS